MLIGRYYLEVCLFISNVWFKLGQTYKDNTRLKSSHCFGYKRDLDCKEPQNITTVTKAEDLHYGNAELASCSFLWREPRDPKPLW
ncbi:hypothetical protein AOLI_G00010100 [Acnodon oligacanthus]